MSNFYALINRMKYIKRWSLMRNSIDENLLEHSYQVAVIAHALALIQNKLYGGKVDAERVAVIALFHDSSEVITGDMPTPVKYNNERLKTAYKEMEKDADRRLIQMLPDFLREEYKGLFDVSPDDETYRFVKAADKISAYIKCMEEGASGNREFSVAEKSIKQQIDAIDILAVKYFMDNCIPGFCCPLDVL